MSVPFSRNSRPAKPAPISHLSDRWRAVVTQPSSDWCQSHAAETPDQQNLPRSRNIRISRGMNLPFSCQLSHKNRSLTLKSGNLESSIDELSGEKCENYEMMKSKGSSDLKPDVRDQSHLAKTRDNRSCPHLAPPASLGTRSASAQTSECLHWNIANTRHFSDDVRSFPATFILNHTHTSSKILAKISQVRYVPVA